VQHRQRRVCSPKVYALVSICACGRRRPSASSQAGKRGVSRVDLLEPVAAEQDARCSGCVGSHLMDDTSAVWPSIWELVRLSATEGHLPTQHSSSCWASTDLPPAFPLAAILNRLTLLRIPYPQRPVCSSRGESLAVAVPCSRTVRINSARPSQLQGCLSPRHLQPKHNQTITSLVW
jgi:hypothetical protein